MRDEYRIVLFDPSGERMSRILTVEASSMAEAALKVAVKASKTGVKLKGERDYKLTLQQYDTDLGTWETIEDMKCGPQGRWFV